MKLTAASALPLRRIGAALPYVVVFAAGLFLLHVADNFEFEEVPGRIGPDAWPKLILLLMLATALWGIVASVIRAGRPQPETEVEEAEDLVRPPEIYPHLVWFAVAAAIVYLLLLPIIGFFLATIGFSFVLMYLGHYRRLGRAAGLSLAIALVFLFLFMRVVYVALPVGVPPFSNVSYALMAAMGVH